MPITIDIGKITATGWVGNSFRVPYGNYIGGYWVRRNFSYNSGSVKQFVPDTLSVGNTTYNTTTNSYMFTNCSPNFPNVALDFVVNSVGGSSTTFGNYQSASGGNTQFNAPNDFCFAPLTKEQLELINYTSSLQASATESAYTNVSFNDQFPPPSPFPVGGPQVVENPSPYNSLMVYFTQMNHGITGNTFTITNGELYLVLYSGGFDGQDITGQLTNYQSPIETETIVPFAKFTGQQKISSNNTLTLDLDFMFTKEGQVILNPFNLYLKSPGELMCGVLNDLGGTIQIVSELNSFSVVMFLPALVGLGGQDTPCGITILSGYKEIFLAVGGSDTSAWNTSFHLNLTCTYDEYKIINDNQEGGYKDYTDGPFYTVCNDRTLFDGKAEIDSILRYEARMNYGSTFSWNLSVNPGYSYSFPDNSLPSGSVVVGHVYNGDGAHLYTLQDITNLAVYCYDKTQFFPIGRVLDAQLTTYAEEWYASSDIEFQDFTGTTSISNVTFDVADSGGNDTWMLPLVNMSNASGGSMASGPGYLTVVGGTDFVNIIDNGTYMQGVGTPSVPMTITTQLYEGDNASSTTGQITTASKEPGGDFIHDNTSLAIQINVPSTSYNFDGSTQYLQLQDPVYTSYLDYLSGPISGECSFSNINFVTDNSGGWPESYYQSVIGQLVNFYQLDLPGLVNSNCRDTYGYLYDEISWNVGTITYDQSVSLSSIFSGYQPQFLPWSYSNLTVTTNNNQLTITCNTKGTNFLKLYAPAFDARNFRYMNITINSSAAYPSLTLTASAYTTSRLATQQNRSWSIGPIQSGTSTYTIDLCNPISGVAFDGTRSAWAYPGGPNYGLGYISTLTFSGFKNPSMLTITEITLSRNGNPVGHCFPEATLPHIPAPSNYNIDIGQEYAPPDLSDGSGNPPPLLLPMSGVGILNDGVSGPYKRNCRLMQAEVDGKIVFDIPHTMMHAGYWSDNNLREVTNFRLSINDVYKLINSQLGVHMTTPAILSSQVFLNPYNLNPDPNYVQPNFPYPSTYNIYGLRTPSVFLTLDPIPTP